jgi:hypothetical protein
MFSVHPVPPDLAQTCAEVPLAGRNHVYTFIVHGTDPFDWANLEGVYEYIQALGFHKTWYGFFYSAHHFKKTIQRLREEDPAARFALVGFSYGCNAVRDMTHALARDGIHIDLLVYVDGKFLSNDPHNQPENAGRLINIVASARIANECNMPGAENISLPHHWHYGTPCDPVTLKTLAFELATLAGSVEVVEEVPPIPHSATAPTPRAIVEQPRGARDEWDFLQPVSVADRPPLPPLPTPRPVEKPNPPQTDSSPASSEKLSRRLP